MRWIDTSILTLFIGNVYLSLREIQRLRPFVDWLKQILVAFLKIYHI